MDNKLQKKLVVILNCVLVLALALWLVPGAFATGESPVSTNLEEETTYSLSEADAGVTYVEDEVLVVFKEGASVAEASAAVDAIEATPSEELTEETIESEDLVVVEILDGATANETLAELNANPAVEYAQPNYIYELVEETAEEEIVLDTIVDDPYAASAQWYLDSINAYTAWDLVRVEETVSIAVIDTGIDMSHPDLVDTIDYAHAYDAYLRQPLTGYVKDHGTHVAGIIAAEANNGQGIAGVSYNASIIPINVFYVLSGGGVNANTATLIEAYEYLFEADIPSLRVINLSLGTTMYDSALEGVINQAAERGILTVCAAGNNGSSEPYYPADFEVCVSVISLDENTERSAFSNYGPQKDISAPGSYIYSTVPVGTNLLNPSPPYDYGYKSGTSMASPIVAGVAALVFAQDATRSISDVKEILYGTATDYGDPGKDIDYGWGQVDATAALSRTVDIEELAGSTRYDTMLEIVQAFSDEVPAVGGTVLIATGDNFPDALAAAGLAGGFDAPILLTATNALSEQTRTALEELDPAHVYIVGGSGAISESVKTQIDQLCGLTSVRLAGATRIETAEQIYAEGKSVGAGGLWSENRTAIVALGSNYPDALSISPYAYASKCPIFLTASDGSLASSTYTLLTSGDFDRVVIVGADDVIPATTATRLEDAGLSVMRYGGLTRYDTCRDIAEFAVAEGVLSWTDIGVATGLNFPDALAAAPLLGERGGLLLLADDSVSGRSVLDVVPDHKYEVDRLAWLGGEDVVPAALRQAFVAALG
ncbi:MAG: S8 family serine peptidase [Actinobacteria bacterium]|nr:S8 family serine peptidase [Actinomycetota bacterium]